MRWRVLQEIWIHPLEYRTEMLLILAAFIILLAVLILKSWKRRG